MLFSMVVRLKLAMDSSVGNAEWLHSFQLQLYGKVIPVYPLSPEQVDFDVDGIACRRLNRCSAYANHLEKYAIRCILRPLVHVMSIVRGKHRANQML